MRNTKLIDAPDPSVPVVVVTRHSAFVALCVERGLCTPDVKVLAHATFGDILGRRVITSGLPLHLAVECEAVVTIPLTIPPDLRGKELTVEQMRKHAEPTATFIVSRAVALENCKSCEGWGCESCHHEGLIHVLQ